MEVFLVEYLTKNNSKEFYNLNERENSHEDIMFILHKNQYYKDSDGTFSETIGG